MQDYSADKLFVVEFLARIDLGSGEYGSCLRKKKGRGGVKEGSRSLDNAFRVDRSTLHQVIKFSLAI